MKLETEEEKGSVHFPKGYESKLGFFETEQAIHMLKRHFPEVFSRELGLKKVSAPRFLFIDGGLQDDLAGTQKAVGFTTKFSKRRIEVVHSLAKWKRFALAKYGFSKGTGLYADMDAIRKDEHISPVHSVYVDQWDWEKVIGREERTLESLKEHVERIYSALKETEREVVLKFSNLHCRLPEKITFVHAEDLEETYPELTPGQREDVFAKEHGAVFIIGIGGDLKSGEPHDLRAADYDDWSTPTLPGRKGLNGDIVVWDDTRMESLEITSMGIRVDARAMLCQLDVMGQRDRMSLEFHSGVLDGSLPPSIGGGIGQSRLCMFMLHKAHIGEVQSSVWPEYVKKSFEEKRVMLL